MKKSLFVSLLALVLALGLGSVSFAQGDLYLAVDGKKVETDAPCFIENNRTLVPVRFIGESLGYNVTWDAGARRVTITNAKADAAAVKIELTIDSNKALVYDAAGESKEVALETAAQITKNRTFVPVRFIGESFGTAVDWDAANRVVIIGDKSLYKAEEFAKLRKAEAPKPAPAKKPAKGKAPSAKEIDGVYVRKDDEGFMLAVVERKKDGFTHVAGAGVLDDSPEGFRLVGNPFGIVYNPKTGTADLGEGVIRFYKGGCTAKEKGSPVDVEYKKVR